MNTASAEMIGRGQITIPKKLREQNGHKEGTQFNVLAVGSGYFLEPIENGFDPVKDIEDGFLQISRNLARSGVSLEDMLTELRRMKTDG